MLYELRMQEKLDEGERKGKRNEALRIAREMVLAGFPSSQIAQITQIPMDEITKLGEKPMADGGC